jgi:hypothetical protein
MFEVEYNEAFQMWDVIHEEEGALASFHTEELANEYVGLKNPEPEVQEALYIHMLYYNDYLISAHREQSKARTELAHHASHPKALLITLSRKKVVKKIVKGNFHIKSIEVR